MPGEAVERISWRRWLPPGSPAVCRNFAECLKSLRLRWLSAGSIGSAAPSLSVRVAGRHAGASASPGVMGYTGFSTFTDPRCARGLRWGSRRGAGGGNCPCSRAARSGRVRGSMARPTDDCRRLGHRRVPIRHCPRGAPLGVRRARPGGALLHGGPRRHRTASRHRAASDLDSLSLCRRGRTCQLMHGTATCCA